MDYKFNIYKTNGQPHKLKVFEFSEDSVVQIPDGSIILHTELLDEFTLEVWVSVPVSSHVEAKTYNYPTPPPPAPEVDPFPIGYPDEELQDSKPVEDFIQYDEEDD